MSALRRVGHKGADLIAPGNTRESFDAARPRMQESARGGHMTRGRQIYNRAGRPCPRCGQTIQARGQWDDNRTTFWCPGCQR